MSVRSVAGMIMGIVIVALTASMATRSVAQGARVSEPTPTQLAEFTIRDRAAGLEWLRCSVGQVWNGSTCIGVAQTLTLAQAEQAAAMASRELGGSWRLPTLPELRQLLCVDCKPPKIDGRLYPNTMATAYWTSSENDWSFGRYWSLNFHTGHSFGRNAQDTARHVRLVRDLPRPNQAKDP
jgi:hypothetical protein